MLNFLKGTILLSILLAAYLVSGPMLIAVRDELIEQKNSFINQPYSEIVVPSSIFIYITTLYVLYSVRLVELPIGILKTFLTVLVSLLFDFGARILFLLKFNIKIRSTGPFALDSALLCSYCILYPTYRSSILPISDKLAMFFIILVSGLFDDLLAIVPIVCGIAAFFLLSPIIIPLEKSKNI